MSSPKRSPGRNTSSIIGDFKSLSPAVWRASTVVFDSAAAFAQRKTQLYDGYTYGITGTPTTRELESRIAALESAEHCVVLPSGQSALCAALMAVLRGGDHVLISDAAYGPLKNFAQQWLTPMNIEVDVFPPTAGANIAEFVKRNTRLICLESPGSITMEMQDIPAIAAFARANGILTMVDNTWATPLGFKPVAHGVDISMQAASKLISGHSDLLLGALSTNDRKIYERLRDTQNTMGLAVSPDDCFLAMRGMETLEIRLAAQSAAAMKVATWLAGQDGVVDVLYPALPSDPGYALWRRDFRTAGTVFSLVLKQAATAAYDAFFSALRTFTIGASWGGVHSLAAIYPAAEQQRRRYPGPDATIIRLSIGLEGLDKLIGDLSSALQAFHAAQDAPATA